ncbi:MAG TPA: beta-glucosidase [Bordetella sp.]|nr:beta-glucosidase [Bordetella sp.]
MQAGFECSCHRFPDGRRLDLISSTGHDRWADSDYAAAASQGIHTVRDGVRWHLVGRASRCYDWSSLRPLVAAANAHGTQVIWDLCHYGWPDWLDIWSARFPEEFARYAAAAARLLSNESAVPPVYCPVNEISYWAWAGGDMAHFGPCAMGRGPELKRQLVRAAIQATDAILEVDPGARLLAADPLISIHASFDGDEEAAREADAAQFEAWDMLTGRWEPGLGGDPRYLDIVGLNYYPHNQWRLGGPTVPPGDPQYRPLRQLLASAARRYGRPLLIAETGAEGGARADWLRYVADETAQALQAGVPVTGICLYPITDYPGWEDDRACPTGLFGVPSADGERTVHAALAVEVERQSRRFAGLLTEEPDPGSTWPAAGADGG